MKINHIKINGFGKLKDKEIDLIDKFNIIYGRNEAGKSTLQKFIPGILYGLSKSKNGKELSDFDKYYPWSSLEYSGKINYTLDNLEEFEVFRDFLKKNPIIYNKNKLDITANFGIDKSKGITFFEEQTGIDEKTFLDTAVTEQQNVRLNKASQGNVIQKIANIVSSGDENISYKNTLEKINKMQLERVGNSRTTQKPLNLVENRIIELEKQKFTYQDISFRNEDNVKELKHQEVELERAINKAALLKEMREYLESSKIKVAELDFNKQLENEYDEKIEELQKRIDIKSRQNVRLQKKNYMMNYIILAIMIVIAIVLQIFIKKIYFSVIPCVLAVLDVVYIIWDKIDKNKKVKEKLKQIEELQNEVNKEIEILKKGKEEKNFQTKIKNERFYVEIQKNEERLMEKYSSIVGSNYIEEVFSYELEDINPLLAEQEEIIDNLKMSIYTLSQNKNIAEKEMANYEGINAELETLRSEKDYLVSLNNSFELAKICLEKAYQEMKEKVSPKLTKKLCEMVDKISNGKYKNIVFDDENGLCVELENGQYMSVSRLSVGTIDQLYLALRISVINEITEEKMPIILDEAFAYFDNERLENLLKFLVEEYPENQVIIFTCSNREVEALDKLNIGDYNYIEL